VRDLSGTVAGYFSVDGGVTHLQSFNTNSSGDFGDWAASAGADAFDAFSPSGVVNKITAGDLTAIDAIGWGQYGTAAALGSSSPPGTAVHLAASQAVATYGADALRALLAVGHGFYEDSLVADQDAYYGA
jgi:hypothetical protein